MQKHSEWLSNRGYIQHIKVLTKIQHRRSQNISKTLLLNKALGSTSPERFSHNSNHKRDKSSDSPNFTRSKDLRSKDNITMRQQQILWDNYYLGKRIIETPPVISKRRQDEDYRKHKRLVECLTSSNNRKILPNEFRVKKFQEYKENMEQLAPGKAILTATHKYYLRLEITDLVFYRQKPSLDELLLVLTHQTKEGKLKKQKTENFPANQILGRHFYFSVPKRLLYSEQPLTVEVQNLKGLEQLSIGYFSFPAKVENAYKPQVFHCGKVVGEIEITVLGGKFQESHLRSLP